MAGSFLRLILSAVICLFSASACASQYLTVPVNYQHIAGEFGIPASVLYAVVMQESGNWPWTINVAGKGYHYQTRQQAETAVQQFIHHWPLTRIDVGIAQINLGHNGHWFTDYHQAFDPDVNLRVAAKIIKACYQQHGDWIFATGCYHHPAGGIHAVNYRESVRKRLEKIQYGVSYTDIVWISPQTTSNMLTCACTWILPEK